MFPKACERSPAEARARVLVVDDERLMRWALRQRLIQAGHDVLEAGTGVSALEAIAAREDVAVMVLDYRLPDMDGFEVLRRARIARPACRVIVITAHAAPEHEASARALGAAGYVAKPFDGDIMVDLVQSLLAAGR